MPAAALRRRLTAAPHARADGEPAAAGLPIAVTAEPLELEPLIRAVRTDACGAVVAFLGVVRIAADDGRAVVGLSYEAHATLAVAELRRIAAEAAERFDGARVAIVHRTGALGLGEASVAIAAASAHRAAAFDACEYAIDELKARVPVWKREHYADGASGWRENAAG